MRLGKDLENKPLISVSNGQIVGRTKDVYLDAHVTTLTGLYVGSEGVIRRKDLIIPTDRVTLLGVDVILVQDPDVVTTARATPESEKWHRLSQLHGKEVYTPGGTKLATIDDVTLDEHGAVSGFSLSRVFVTGPLAEERFIPRDVVVDAFQSSDALLIDFPKLEALFTASQQTAPVEPEEEKPIDLPKDSAEEAQDAE